MSRIQSYKELLYHDFEKSVHCLFAGHFIYRQNNHIPKICSNLVLGLAGSQGVLNFESGIGPRKWCMSQKSGINIIANRETIPITDIQSISNLDSFDFIKYSEKICYVIMTSLDFFIIVIDIMFFNKVIAKLSVEPIYQISMRELIVKNLRIQTDIKTNSIV